MMIEVNNLVKEYGEHTAVRGISFTVQKGEILGFLGPNGAGKTTTMRILTGALSPTSGSVKLSGFDIQEQPIEVKRRIGYLPETPPLYMDFSVESYLKFVAQIKDVPEKLIDERLQWSMQKCGLLEVRKRLIGNLSKGFRQRVGLAQAIINKPDVLILDEPTVGLDPKQIKEIRSMIQELSEEHTIILSTHILPEVMMICDRATIINRGRIVKEGTISDLTKEQSLEELFIELISQEDL